MTNESMTMSTRPRPDSESGNTTHNSSSSDEKATSYCSRDHCEGGVRGWVVTFAAFMVHVMTTGFVKSLGAFFVTWQDVFSEGAAAVGWISSLTIFFMLTSGPFAAVLSKRFGCRPVAMFGGFLATACVTVASMVSYLYELIVLMVFAGIGLGFVYQPSISIISLTFKRRLAAAMGISFSGVGVGIIAFPPLMTALIDWYGWQGAMSVLAAIIAHLCVAGTLYKPSNYEMKQIKRRRKKIKDKTRQDVRKELPQNKEDSNSKDSSYVCERDCANVIKEKCVTEPIADTKCASTVDRSDIDTISIRVKFDNPPHIDNCADKNTRIEVEKSEKYDEKQKMNSPPRCTDTEVHASTSDITSVAMHQIKIVRNPVATTTPKRSHVTSPFSFLIRTFQLDLLITNFRFLALCIVVCLFGCGYYAALVYTVSRAVSINITNTNAALLVSIIGVGSFVGRLSHGSCIDSGVITPPRLLTLVLLVMSASCLLLPLTQSFETMAIPAVFFGVSSGIANALFPVHAHMFVEESKAGNSIGLYLMFLGVGDVTGVLMVGGLFDITGSYDSSYYAAGIISFVSFFIVMLEPLLKRLQFKFDARRRSQRGTGSRSRKT